MFICRSGNRQRVTRASLLSEIVAEAASKSISVKLDQSANWQRDMNSTKFNLAPRGYGRNSYRLAEIVQMGRIPVVLFNDVAWLPYENTEMDFRLFGLLGKAGQMGVLIKQIVEMNAEEEMRRMKNIKEVRHWYTYAGVLEQIALFFLDPLGERGGYLRCMRVPHTPLGHDSSAATSATVHMTHKQRPH